MFGRKILGDLRDWANKKNRKPLILRGARQVGKTTIVNMFAQEFDHFLSLNLDIVTDRRPFIEAESIVDLIPALFFLKGQAQKPGKTLIFIDEIQNCAEAIQLLRYFYEQAPHFYVIAAGSLLETALNFQLSFPVGRVEYLYMKPLTFEEYLLAMEEDQAVDALNTIPFPKYAHDSLLKHFYTYTMIGGMPEVIERYRESRDLYALNKVYENLLRSYLDDVDKYARTQPLVPVIQHAMESAFREACQRIHFEGFGHSHYRSREMGEALRTLEKAMLITLMYPTTNVQMPMEKDLKKAPRLHLLDTGLVNYFAGFQKEIFTTKKIDHVYRGKIAEHIVGQEFLAIYQELNEPVSFWVREKKQSNAEVDFALAFDHQIIPVEVKSSSVGRLRSLHRFMEKAPHNLAVRVYSGNLSIDNVQTTDEKKSFKLLNLPFYLSGKIKDYLISPEKVR